MYLRQFAKDHRLKLVHRDDGSAHVSTVDNACVEAGFYELRRASTGPAPNLPDKETAEAYLSRIEGATARLLDDINATGMMPKTNEEVAALISFAGVQAFRGRRHRSHLGATSTRLAQEMAETLVARDAGKDPAVDPAIRGVVAAVRAGAMVTVQLDQDYEVAQALVMGAEDAAHRLWKMNWCIVAFDKPSILTSDEPVVAWHPSRMPSDVMTAPKVWLPLGRRHVLEFTEVSSGSNSMTREDDSILAQQVNALVAAQAHMWIVHHPDDEYLLSGVAPNLLDD
jgi:hypothetical protein